MTLAGTHSTGRNERNKHEVSTRSGRPIASRVLSTLLLLLLALYALSLVPSVASEEAGDELVHALQEVEPVANAGPDQTVTEGDRVVLNGSLSTGFEGPDKLNYTWYLAFPLGKATLYGQVVSFQASQLGTMQISLTVRDSLNRTDTDELTVVVLAKKLSFTDRYWLPLIIAAIVCVPVGLWLIGALLRVMRGEPAVPTTMKEKALLYMASVRRIARQYRKSVSGMLGLSIMIFFIMMAAFAPYLANFDDPKSISWSGVNPHRAPPSSTYWMGTDFYGRDVWSLTVWGSRASLTVGLMASLISIVLGTSVGLAAGYFGKFSDEFLMRVTDFFLVIPWLPLMIVFAMVMGRSFTNIIIVIGITSWSSTARIVRAQVMSVKEKMFIQRAICVGSGDLRIISRHVLPNVVPLIFANTILLIANSIFSESFLEFFNLGDPDVISWGTMLEESYSNGDFNSVAWWDYAFPGACIVILIMAFYLIGDALDEVLNPKLRRR